MKDTTEKKREPNTLITQDLITGKLIVTRKTKDNERYFNAVIKRMKEDKS